MKRLHRLGQSILTAVLLALAFIPTGMTHASDRPDSPSSETSQDDPVTFETVRDAFKASYLAGEIITSNEYNNLQSKLDNAERAYQRGDIGTAVNVLEALINSIEAASGSAIEEETADELIELILALIGWVLDHPDPTPTPSLTPQPSATPSVTPSLTPPPSATPSVTPSATPLPGETPSLTPLPSGTPPPSETPAPLTAPRLIDPRGRIGSDQPVFQWESVPGATRYQVQVTDPSGGDFYVNHWVEAAAVCSGSLCAWPSPALLEEAPYIWQVRAGRTGEEGPWSISLAFRVELPPEPPRPTAPQGQIHTNRPDFEWEGHEGDTAYTVQVLSGETVVLTASSSSEACEDSSCSLTSTISLPDGEYTLRVNASDGLETSDWSEGLDFSILTALDQPTLISPLGLIEDSSPAYSWTSVRDATDYTLLVSSGGEALYSYQVSAGESCSGGVCSLLPTEELDLGNYRWQVMAQGGDLPPVWSDPGEFSVVEPLTAPPDLLLTILVDDEQLETGDNTRVRVTIQNVGTVAAQDVRFRNALPASFDNATTELDRQAGDRIVNVETASRDLISGVGLLLPGESVTLFYSIQATDIPVGKAQIVTDVVQASGAGLSEPLVAEIEVLVVQRGPAWGMIKAGRETVVRASDVDLRIPADSPPVEAGVAFIDQEEARSQEDRESDLLLIFELSLLEDPGPSRPALRVAADNELSRADAPNPTLPAGDAAERLDAALSRVLDEIRDLEEGPETFDEEVMVTVDYDALTDLSALWMDQTPFVAVYYEASGVWVKQPDLTVDKDANTVGLETSHFSTWGAGVAGVFPENGASIPLYDEARVSAFTGRASYGYPLWVPAGRAGMGPSVTLSYASGSVDGILGDVQSPWVGTGWNIDAVEVTRKVTNGGCGASSSCGSGVYGYENEFVLVFNGTSYQLIEDPTDASRFFTEEHSFLYIVRHNADLGNEEVDSTAPPNTADEWWEVATSDGTRYRIGWNADSEQLAPMPGYTLSLGGAWTGLGYAGEASHRVALRWRVDLVSDVYGNAISYTYDEETRAVAGQSVDYDRASYLDTIRYTGSGGDACAPASESCYEVRFVRAARATGYDLPDSGDIEDWDNWDSDYLDKVEVYAMDSGGDELLRTYDFTYSEVNRQDSDGDSETWDSIVLDEIVVTAGSLSAPKISFVYTNFDNRAQVLYEPEWGYPRLTEIHNGTEGKVTFTYGEDGRPASQYYAWRVLWRKVYDGVTSDAMRTDYVYGPACYNDASDEEEGWCNEDDDGSLVGHEWAEEKVKEFGVNGATLNTVKHYYYSDEQKVGREWKTETRDANNVLTFKSETDFTTVTSTENSAYPEDVYFIYADESRSYEKRGTILTLTSYSNWTYDDDYGRVLTASTYDGSDNLLTSTTYTYLDNDSSPETTFLHSFPRSVITEDAEEVTLSETYYAYDGTADSLGTKGELSLQQTVDLTAPTRTFDTSYTYDSYGNVTETRAYADYGTLGTLPSTDAEDRTSTVTYDSTYQMYPVEAENDLGHTVSTTYDFQLAEAPLGLPRQVTDANGQTAETVYDDLGRAIESWQPGAAQAVIKTIYPTLNGSGEIDAPYTIELQIWDDGGPGGSQYRKAWAFYDGLGRTLRTVGPAEGTDKYIQTDLRFNAMGLADRSARPYEVTLITPPGTYSAPNWGTLKYTAMTYDSFGRATTITAPDGATVQTVYNGRETTVIDPKGHKRTSIADDFGRLISVQEYSGDGSSADPYALYATTTYAYDSRSLLTGVTDEEENVTSISYDALGRKTGMDDPDMGAWSYTYDRWGQLRQQIDARGAALCFEYDILGRVTERQAGLTAEDCGDTGDLSTIATYSYDDVTGGNYGIGRLTGMEALFAGATPTVVDAISYDALGRAVETTRTIDSADYTTSTTYDSIGRVLSVTYPTSETVTTTYNARGLFEGLSGTDTYVSATDYTATGGIDDQTLGNGVVTDFSYYTDSNRLERIFIAKPAYLPLLDLTYDYDEAGNITQVTDEVNDEIRSYQYDFLDRLIFADVYSGPQMLEERYYVYNTIGNLMSFRLRYPSSHTGNGAFTPGAGSSAATSNQGAAGFNPLSGNSMSGSTYSGFGRLPYNGGVTGQTAAGGYNTRGSFQSGANASGTIYQGAASFNPFAGAANTGNFEGGGITPYVRGNNNGFGGDTGLPYNGPTGESVLNYVYGVGSAGPHAVTSLSDGSTFTYDANGNMVTRYDAETTTSWTYTFDAENRLVSVSDGTTTTTYVYDGNGSRVKRVVDHGLTETVTIYVARMEITLVDEVEEKRTIYYGRGGAFRVVGGENPGLYYRHTDRQGSTSVMTDSSGLKVEGSSVLYAPFGEIRLGEQSELTDFGYTGQRLDSSTGGLMYYGARYYLPGLRRFISPDTIVPNLAKPQSLNRFAYSYNNPIKYTDPSGHIACVDGMFCGSGTAYHYLTTPIKNDLQRNGVTVEFDSNISLGDRIDSYRTINEVVEAYAGRIEEQGGTFAEVMLPTVVQVHDSPSPNYIYNHGQGNIKTYPPASCNDCGKYGLNTPFRDSKGNLILENGKYVGFNIHLELDRLLGTVKKNEGVSLVAHEFGHNIAWNGVFANDYLNNPTFFAVDASTVNAVDDPKTTEVEGGTAADWAAEQSADAYASWALERYDESAMRAHDPNLTVDQVDQYISCVIVPASCNQ